MDFHYTLYSRLAQGDRSMLVAVPPDLSEIIRPPKAHFRLIFISDFSLTQMTLHLTLSNLQVNT